MVLSVTEFAFCMFVSFVVFITIHPDTTSTRLWSMGQNPPAQQRG